MKKIISILLCFIIATGVSGCMRSSEKSDPASSYIVRRANAGINREKSSEAYYYKTTSNVFRYSFQDGNTETIMEIDGYIYSFCVSGEWIYYCLFGGDETRKEGWGGKLIRYNYHSGEEETLLTRPTAFGVDIVDNTLILVSGNICEIGFTDGNLETDMKDVNDLFPEEEYSGEKQQITYQGIIFIRYYDTEQSCYVLDSIREEKTGHRMFYLKEASVWIEGEKFEILTKEKQDNERFWYQTEGGEPRLLDCLDNFLYRHSDIHGNMLTVEKGNIIGILTISNNWRDSMELSQGNIEGEVLFQLNPKTGENHIIGRTRDSRTRIIGYKDGTVYLFRDHKIYSQPAEGREKTQLLALPERSRWIFDWQADYLVICGDNGTLQNYDEVYSYKIE